MRTFNDFEKNVLALMVKEDIIKSTHDLMRQVLNINYWGWSQDYKSIYYPIKTEDEVNIVRNNFLDLMALFDYLGPNFLATFYQLENNGSLVIKNAELFGNPAFVVSSDGREIKKEDFEGFCGNDPASIGRKIEYYTRSMFHVTQTLKEFVNNDFKTIEQRNFEQQLKDANKQHNEQMRSVKSTLCWTRAAFVVALIPALIGVYSFFSDISIRKLNNTIKEKKYSNVTPTKVSDDTLKLNSMTNNKHEKENIRNKK